MPRWVAALSDDGWLNLDRLDGIQIIGTPSGERCLIVAERRGAPNTILGSFPNHEAARRRVHELIGDDLDGPGRPNPEH